VKLVDHETVLRVSLMLQMYLKKFFKKILFRKV